MSDLALFDLDSVVEEWTPIYAMGACRDCGRSKFTWEHGCGGAHGPGLFNLCDDCASLDGVGARRDPAEADVSRWGIRTTELERDELRALQVRRRAKYLAEVAA